MFTDEGTSASVIIPASQIVTHFSPRGKQKQNQNRRQKRKKQKHKHDPYVWAKKTELSATKLSPSLLSEPVYLQTKPHLLSCLALILTRRILSLWLRPTVP